MLNMIFVFGLIFFTEKNTWCLSGLILFTSIHTISSIYEKSFGKVFQCMPSELNDERVPSMKNATFLSLLLIKSVTKYPYLDKFFLRSTEFTRFFPYVWVCGFAMTSRIISVAYGILVFLSILLIFYIKGYQRLVCFAV